MSLLDTVFPSACAGCGGPVGLTCPRCLASLAGPAAVVWPRPAPVGLPPPWTVTPYEGACRALVIAYKERGVVGLRATLAAPLAVAIGAAVCSAGCRRGDRPVIVVPVPSSPRAVRDRGDDVVLALTRRAASSARHRGVSVTVVPALRLDRRVVDSAGLSAAARAANLAGAFVVRRPAIGLLTGARIVVADDLMTTGTSIAEAARALRECGGEVIGAATIASTRRRDDREVLGMHAVGTTVRK
jgi:predicted amidophosphoribosyltransferase